MNTMKLGARQLRRSQPSNSDLTKIRRREIYIVCDNVLDTYNVGSIFRLADAVAAKRIYLCGQTETPPYHRISKAAVGTEKWVPWEYASTAVEAIAKVRSQSFDGFRMTLSDNRMGQRDRFPSEKRKCKVIAIEQSPKAVDFRKANYDEPIAFVVGNETDGVSKEALATVDEIVEIPMFGVNKSLNVMVSLAIVLFKAI